MGASNARGAASVDLTQGGFAGSFSTLTVSGVSTFSAGTVGAPSIQLSTDTTTGLYRPAANQIGIAVSGSQVALITSTGLAVTGTITANTATAGTNTTQVATTAFVTTAVANAVAGVNPAESVKAATTQASDTSGLTYSNGVAGVGATFTGSVNTALTFDGQTLTALAQRVLIKNDTQSPSGAFNGVYYLTQIQTAILPPILTRALDYNSPSEMNNTGIVPVVSGTTNGGTSWLLTTTVTTVGTDPLTYSLFTQNPAAVAITGGTIDGAVIGGITPAAGTHTTLSVTGLGTFSTMTGVPNSTVTATQNVVFWNVQPTCPGTSDSTATFVGFRGEVQHTGLADINTPGHTVGVFGHSIMNATGHLGVLGIGVEGKITVNAGTMSAGESLRGVLEDVIVGNTLTTWTGAHCKIADCHGTLGTGIGFDFSNITISGAAATTLMGHRAVDVTTAQATNYSGFRSDANTATSHWGFDASGTANNRFNGNCKFGSTGVPAHLVDIAAGTTTVAPILFASGTNLTSALAGAVEYDGRCIYGTTVASSRQVVCAEQFALNVNAVSLGNNSNAQSFLESGNTTLTVAAATSYFFEGLVEIEGMGANSHTTAFAFGGTATFTACQYMSMSWSGTAAAAVAAQSTKITQVATSTVVIAASTSAASTLWVRGIIRVNGAGTIIPQIAFSTDPSGTITATSQCYFKLSPVGSNTVAAAGNWA